MGVRYYAGWFVRWTSGDPIATGDGVNRYAYVQGNPIRARDPGGTVGLFDDPFEIVDLGDQLVGAAAVAERQAAAGKDPVAGVAAAAPKLKTSFDSVVPDSPVLRGIGLGLGDIALGVFEGASEVAQNPGKAFAEGPLRAVRDVAGLVHGTNEAAQDLAVSASDINIAKATGDEAGLALAKERTARAGVNTAAGTVGIVGTGLLGLGQRVQPRTGAAVATEPGQASATPRSAGRVSAQASADAAPAPAPSQAVPTSPGEVVFDANALVNAIEGDGAALRAANGRRPVVPDEAAEEFVTGRRLDRELLGEQLTRDVLEGALQQFLEETGGRAAEIPSIESVEAARAGGARTTPRNRRHGRIGDPAVVGTAIQENLHFLTQDTRLLRHFPTIAEWF